ncbi:hypothetical protein G7B40_022685 [Aetokthonos hydrillicola Thurmond2011]|jgi:hypothetical protein|uniref:Uncharacterized protein n=1 Tax=Aetokthonos hydrillicola Thurmond2011 TaxID=2712845 RepID=A0AAP5I9B5_9CYAN|nr:hypothetical protein [Aetokthonos hydrillicola]MBO3461442.1 hypothetical protein [Aetokthonos hydrillicola CCALA 1050]MBW4588784.1 hypothetical protein [Aetokthonos hydrillicola CCALA 1050]MDR9897352.1 hypothetical protein [Aetokthonos hydrillicola Thurmond2011]
MKKFIIISSTSLICLLISYFGTQVVGKKTAYVIGGGMFFIGSSALIAQTIGDRKANALNPIAEYSSHSSSTKRSS